MLSCVEIFLFAALGLIAPQDGATVPVLSENQRAYLEKPTAARYKAMADRVERIKLAGSGEYQRPLELQWSGETNALYTLTVDFAEGGDKRVFEIVGRTSARITNLELGREYRWSVEKGGEKATATFKTAAEAPRLLRAGGVRNFRDLGGWKTTDRRRVKQNMILRCAGLRSSASKEGGGLFGGKFRPGEQRVTERGIKTLREDFKIATDLELRNDQESVFLTTTLLGKGTAWVRVPFAAYDFIDERERGRQPFARIFRLFLDRANYPVLMHCSGGRDRTGTLAYLLNAILGVEKDDLSRDWEVTAFGDESLSFSPDRLQRLVEYLDSCGGAAAYARRCGITDEELAEFRAIMLEDETEVAK